MRQALGFIASVLLHAAVAGAGLLYFPQASRLAADMIIVPVELVSLSDMTNIRAARPEPEPEIEPDIAEAPPLPETAPEPVPEPVPETVREPEIIPPAPQAEPEPAPPEPAPEPAPPQPRERPRQPEPQGLDLADLSRLVDRSRERSTARQPAEEDQERRRAGAGTAMTATLQTMAASQIARCVRSNADAPADMNLAVVVEVRLERDGSLSRPPRLVDESRILNSPNPFLRVAGERAMRAVIECAPYRLPPEAYAEWRLLHVNVDTQRGR